MRQAVLGNMGLVLFGNRLRNDKVVVASRTILPLKRETWIPVLRVRAVRSYPLQLSIYIYIYKDSS